MAHQTFPFPIILNPRQPTKYFFDLGLWSACEQYPGCGRSFPEMLNKPIEFADELIFLSFGLVKPVDDKR